MNQLCLGIVDCVDSLYFTMDSKSGFAGCCSVACFLHKSLGLLCRQAVAHKGSALAMVGSFRHPGPTAVNNVYDSKLRTFDERIQSRLGHKPNNDYKEIGHGSYCVSGAVVSCFNVCRDTILC
jgi:hypothetical protein